MLQARATRAWRRTCRAAKIVDYGNRHLHGAIDQAAHRRRARIARRLAARAVRRPADQHRPQHRHGRGHRRDGAPRHRERLPAQRARDRRPRQPRDAEHLRGGVQGASRHRRTLRWRIEHAQHISAADIPRFGQLGVIASMQAIHCTSDAPYVLRGSARSAREEGAYVWQKLMKAAPSSPTAPTRRSRTSTRCPASTRSSTRKLKNGEAFFPDQRMTPRRGAEGLHAQRRVRRVRGEHQGLADGRQAGRHHRAVEGHHDRARGGDPDDRGALHDRRREGAVQES